MPRFSAFTPFGHLRFSGRPSDGEQIYRSMRAALTDPRTGRSPYDLSPGTHEEGKLYAQAMGLSGAKATAERAANQADALRAGDLLPNLERDLLITPRARDTLLARRSMVAAKRKLVRGATRESIVDTLRTALGDDFVAYRPVEWSEAAVFPSDPGASNQVHAAEATRPARYLRLLEPITELSVPVWVPYSNWDAAAGDVVLGSGDVVMVQPDHSGLSERVTVGATRTVGVVRELRAVFTKSHDEGALVTTIDWPWQISTSRCSFVVLRPAAALNPELRRKVNELMARLARGISQWAIVAATGPDAVGPCVLGKTPLGSAPLGVAPFTRSR